MIPRLRRLAVLGGCAGLAVAGLAACGVPPELRGPTGAPVPRPTVPSPTTVAPSPTLTAPPVSPGPTTPSFAESFAVPCNNHPGGDQVIRLARTAGVLPAGTRATVATGPLCAGTWQYTVLTVPQREPLQVVSRGRPTALRLVTAGTDVCSIQVRTEAPTGILTAANCPAPGI